MEDAGAKLRVEWKTPHKTPRCKIKKIWWSAAIGLALGGCMVDESVQVKPDAAAQIQAVQLDSSKTQKAAAEMSLVEKALFENSSALCQKAALAMETGAVAPDIAWEACGKTWTQFLVQDSSADCVESYAQAVNPTGANSTVSSDQTMITTNELRRTCVDQAVVVDPFDPNQKIDDQACAYLYTRQASGSEACAGDANCNLELKTTLANAAVVSGCAWGDSGVVDPGEWTGACTREYMPVCGVIRPVETVSSELNEMKLGAWLGEPVYTTFSNKCELEKSGYSFVSEGACPTQVPDSTVMDVCPALYAPVCAEIDPCPVQPNGVQCLAMPYTKTFENQCQAEKAGAKVLADPTACK